MNAERMAKALGGRRSGDGWTACCPAHDDRKPSLSIRDANGKTLVHCHTGCQQMDVIAALRELGLWPRNGRRLRSSTTRNAPVRQPDEDETRRSDAALQTWHSSGPACGTLAERYLLSRGIHVPPPAALRFHPGLKHPTGGIWPAMVALVTSGADGTPRAIHRTFLARDGAGKAPVDPQRMMLGRCGGGVVCLADPIDVLLVGEGVETCLAAMQAAGHPTWAALSTSGLRSLCLPANVRDVIVLADGDKAGETAARACALRWKWEGRRVRIAHPPRGLDFNDVLIGHAPCLQQAAP